MSPEPCRSTLNSVSYCSQQQSHHLTLTQQDASICTNQEFDYYRYYDLDEAAFDGNEVELVSRVSKATRVDYFSSPHQPSWPPAQAVDGVGSAESLRLQAEGGGHGGYGDTSGGVSGR
ncbi:hypothetical protein E2562_031090 [Oryza meyeriana var. granulata]|uniref:Uncharacterized protein n=1 Tax=Oryza meyeriana var. granulata TaxID=110450 RepID=A0A6G1E3T5_9ORYZ|nr:hypothetical protein E2562_031090 [Oryza meyeriana var. granulata]